MRTENITQLPHRLRIYSRRLRSRDWFGQTWQERLPLLVFLFLFQGLYFPINQIADDGVHLYIAVLDGARPIIGWFIVPYGLGFFFLGLMFPLAAVWFPRALFREYAVAFFIIMCVGFTIWVVMPAGIQKGPFVPQSFFERVIADVHEGDRHYGTHNSFPSSHVYYITLGLYYFNRRFPKYWLFYAVCTVLNAFSTVFTHQHYFIDVFAGLLMVPLAVGVARAALRAYDRRGSPPLP